MEKECTNTVKGYSFSAQKMADVNTDHCYGTIPRAVSR